MTMTDVEKRVWAAAFAMRKGQGVTPENAAAFACITVKQLREMNTGLLCNTAWIREMLQDVFGRELEVTPVQTIEPDAMCQSPGPLPGPPPLPKLPQPPKAELPEPPTLPPPPKKPEAKKEAPKRNLRW